MDAEKFKDFYESGFGERIMKKEAQYIYGELKDCGRILDIGCGVGAFERELSGLNITGLDVSEDMLEKARQGSRNTFVLGEAENLKFDDLSFDCVFYVTTLEFIENFEKAVGEAYRVTKPAGKLLAMMLNPESEYFNKHFQKNSSYFRKIKHRKIGVIVKYISKFFEISKQEYFLGVKGGKIFNSSSKTEAALYAVVGEKS